MGYTGWFQTICQKRNTGTAGINKQITYSNVDTDMQFWHLSAAAETASLTLIVIPCWFFEQHSSLHHYEACGYAYY